MLQEKQQGNHMFKFDFDIDDDYASEEQVDPTIIIGYYNLRGKAQVPRLLCQYLQIDYKDELFSLTQWDRHKRTKASKWDFKDLPFLKQGDFVLSQPTPICIYLIKRFGDQQLLGRTLQDKSLVTMYVWTIQTMGNIININCQKKTPEQLMQLKKNQWNNNVAPRLQKYEEVAKQNDYFLGYFTLIDLSMYQLVRYMQLIFPGQMARFPRIKGIQQRVSVIPSIKNYQISSRAITQTDPTTLLQELKRNKLAQMNQQAQEAQGGAASTTNSQISPKNSTKN